MPNAIITGATHGIGKATALHLLQEGCSIAICARNAAELQAMQQAWQAQYPTQQILAIPTDVANKEALAAFATAVLKAFPTIDILVNNAGIFQPGLLMSEADGLLENMMAVNLYSAYHLTRHLLPAIKAAKGHIFNMCSVASLKAYTNGGAYSITKYALQGFSANLREELMPYGIRVTAIMPGATHSRSWAGSNLPDDRLMKAEDVAQILWSSFCLSPQACVEEIILRPMAGDL